MDGWGGRMGAYHVGADFPAGDLVVDDHCEWERELVVRREGGRQVGGGRNVMVLMDDGWRRGD